MAARLEFGTTHALAGAPEWVALFDAPQIDADRKLVAIGEVLGHIADDARLGRPTPFPPGERPWNEAAFLAAIESEDEPAAIARLRGALAAGVRPGALLPVLVGSALSHYADFGHALIYAVKTVELADRLGPASHEPLLLMLARSLVNATREDLLPEFRDYAAQLAGWGQGRDATALEAAALRGRAAKSAMAVVAGWGRRHAPEAIFPVLVEAAAWTLLHVDPRALTRIDAKLADNVGWLDFTHALTFADAARVAVSLRPELWPAVLLQMACFIGRNAGYVDPALDARPLRSRRHAAIPGAGDGRAVRPRARPLHHLGPPSQDAAGGGTADGGAARAGADDRGGGQPVPARADEGPAYPAHGTADAGIGVGRIAAHG